MTRDNELLMFVWKLNSHWYLIDHWKIQSSIINFILINFVFKKPKCVWSFWIWFDCWTHGRMSRDNCDISDWRFNNLQYLAVIDPPFVNFFCGLRPFNFGIISLLWIIEWVWNTTWQVKCNWFLATSYSLIGRLRLLWIYQ